MKNNNKTATVAKADMPSLLTLSDQFKAFRDAKAAYRATCGAFTDQLRKAISDLPQETPVLNRDLAKAAGMTPLHMANVINAHGDSRIHSTSVTVTRRFVEIDEDGAPISDTVIERQSTLVGYYGKGGCRW